VREADEYEIAKVDGVPLLPLSQINERFTELDPNQHTICTAKPACVR
jgi:rhodanese-related sulfurtransferase